MKFAALTKSPLARLLLVPALACLSAVSLGFADSATKYKVDVAHASVAFNISHEEVSKVWGIFSAVNGEISIGSDADESAFNLTVKADSINTGIAKRDEILKGNDWFAVAQHPVITFKSTKVAKSGDNTYDVTGNLTLRGVTKEVTVKFTASEEKKGMQGGMVRGFDTTLTIKRSDFGMKTYIGPVGDEVQLFISVETMKQ
jgi:polyisoprenoid-binding protein YceI